MFLLCNGNGSGSREARPTGRINDSQWVLVRRLAKRILRLSNRADAADTLENLPFELWKATNGFGDEFEILTMKIPVKTYLEIELEADTHQGGQRFERIAEAMKEAGNPVRFIGMEANTEDSDIIPTPQLQTTSVAVIRALSDFETLISSSSGPISGVNRIHTALHGYLKAVCDEAGISYSEDANITVLFKRIREHSRFRENSPGVEGEKILRGMAQVVDALNPVRNDHSMAHPNEELLDEPEAWLAVNATKCLLHYINAKLR